jgi:hypothetical protein
MNSAAFFFIICASIIFSASATTQYGEAEFNHDTASSVAKLELGGVNIAGFDFGMDTTVCLFTMIALI